MTTKKCTKCGRELPLEQFARYPSGKYGVYSRCKECVREGNKEYYYEKRFKIEKQRERHRAAEEREKQLAALTDYEVFGDMRIYILNTKKEYTAVRVSTAEVFRTSDKKEFINYLTSLI